MEMCAANIVLPSMSKRTSASEWVRHAIKIIYIDTVTLLAFDSSDCSKISFKEEQDWLSMLNIHIKMQCHRLTHDNITMIQERMQPKKWSCAGFLSSDQQLDKVMADDSRYLNSVGFTHKQIADRLERYKVTRINTMGYQTCPFSIEEDINCGYGSIEAVITDKVKGSQLCVGDLLIHLIRDHQFFEGPGTHYRLDPKKYLDARFARTSHSLIAPKI